MKKGILSGVLAYMLWGLFPIYIKSLSSVSSFEILSHRIVWSLVFLVILLAFRQQWSWLPNALRDRRVLVTFLAAAVLLGINWYTYIWAVNSGHVVESSLGYFINPLVSVLLGVVILHEKLRPGQWGAVALAGVGVLYLTLRLGSLPWIALILAFSFGLYGLLKKLSPLNSTRGLALETALMFLPALAYLVYREWLGQGSFGHMGAPITVLLILAGVVTSVPLILFSTAAQNIPLYMLGLLQYIAPTLQFLLGVLVYAEPFSLERLVGFSLIWTALLAYTLEGYWQRKKLGKFSKTMGRRRVLVDKKGRA